MYLKTSYVMTDEVFDMLREAEKKTGREAMQLIHRAMQMLANDFKKLRNTFRAVEYQKRVDEETGEKIVKHRVKVKMMKLENILFQDMRRCYLKSISLLIAIALTKYLDRVVAYFLAQCDEDSEDNYLSGNYIYKEKCVENAVCVSVWWGVPPNFYEEFFN